MTKQLCRDCKHLETDGMFGIFCGVGGDNTKYDCPKYAKRRDKMTDIHLTREEWQQLNNRVAKLEKKEKQREQQDIEWALCQFRYSNLTEKQRKAFAIIEQALKKRV